jgi:type IV pilus assembly protein PilQ
MNASFDRTRIDGTRKLESKFEKDARNPATGNAGRITMRVKRLLTVALMALFCAGSATAASQLNSVQVTPKEHSATVSLRTTGSFAHKEYRPDDHLVLVDLNGVTPDASVQRTATLGSPVLKSYKLSSYTSASGSEVTRIELVVGDGVTLEVVDKSDGLQIVLGGADAPKVSRAPTPTPSSAPSPLPAQSAKSSTPVPAYAQPVAKSSAAPAASDSAATKFSTPAPRSESAIPAIIRSVSVQHGHGTLDVVIEGPSNAPQPFLLSHPDRLVLDFDNTVVRASVKNVAVHGKDVLNVRVGRFHAEPPVIRVVIDLTGPRTFDLVKSATQVTVRINSDQATAQEASRNSAPAPALVAASAPVVIPAPVVGTAPAKPSPVNANPPAKFTPEFATETAPARPVTSPAGFGPMILTSPAKPSAEVVTAPAPTKPAIIAIAPAPAPEKPESAAKLPAPAPEPVREVAVKSAPKTQPIEASLPAAAPVSKVASAPVKPAEAQASATYGPTPVASVVPQVHSVQEKLSSASANPQTQEATATAPPHSSGRQSFDPGVRAGVAAETVSASPKSNQVEMAQLTAPGQFPGSASSASTVTSAQKYTGEPISVNLKDVDLKDFFRLIHEISGLNIVLDPSVRGNVTLVLDDVPWDQALDIVLKNNQLDRELQGNVLRIAATDTLRKEAVDRRAQSEAVALAVDRQTVTRFLSYAKASQVVPTIKKFLTARGDIISDERTNALIISDIPSVLPNLDRLISQLDRKSQEVEIEVRVVSASRSFSRDLGVQLGFNWGNGVSTIGGSNPNGATGTSTTGGTTSTSTVPLFTSFSAAGATSGFSISNITKSYGIDAVLTAAEAHNLAKVLSRPRVVTQSNVKAEVKQGVKIPVLTASTANANASVSYVDAVLRLSVTPQITSDNTIFLTVEVENTQPSGILNTNYILTTQQVNTQVLVTDGGTVVIGGVIQTTNSVSTSQTPLLGDIPWLGNLFKERKVSTETDELIFFITPKIIQT